MNSQKVNILMAKKKVQVQGAQIPRNTAPAVAVGVCSWPTHASGYRCTVVHGTDERCSATPKLGFLRSHHGFDSLNKAILPDRAMFLIPIGFNKVWIAFNLSSVPVTSIV